MNWLNDVFYEGLHLLDILCKVYANYSIFRRIMVIILDFQILYGIIARPVNVRRYGENLWSAL